MTSPSFLYYFCATRPLEVRTVGLVLFLQARALQASARLAVMIFPSKAMLKIPGSTIAGSHISFKGHVKKRGLHFYIDATLYGEAHCMTTSVVQHISRSEELALSANSWRRKPLPSCCVLVFSVGWTVATLRIDINCDQMHRLEQVKTTQRKLFSARADMNMLDHCSKHFTGCQSEKGYFLR